MTHLSLTGVQAFLREDLIVFCREAPPGSCISPPPLPVPYSVTQHVPHPSPLTPHVHVTSTPRLTTKIEFNDHQRDVFCVFSGIGVTKLRSYLNNESHIPAYETDGTMYDESEEQEIVINVNAQVSAMAIEEMDEDFGEGSEVMGQD